MKILPVEAELFHADLRIDRQMDTHDGVNIRFSQFCEHDRKNERNKYSEDVQINMEI
jgi:hypothetical protein